MTSDHEETEFAAFAAATWRTLLRSAVLLGNDLHQAEDLAQATLLRCYLKWGRVQVADQRDAYVARVLINLHRQSRRRRWWREQPTDALPEQVEPGAGGELEGADAVRRALEALTPQHREVVVLRFYADLSERATAEVLGIPAGTVKSRLSRALDRLSTDPHLADLLPGGTP